MDPDELLGRVRGQLSDQDFDDLVTMLGQRRARAGRAAAPTPDPRPARGGGRRTFGHTWWGKAWVEALETKARLDPNRLPRGRTYARQNRVTEIDASPGQVEALVQGSRPRPYHVVVQVRQFTDHEWDGVLDAIAAKAAHAAALLDGELLPEILDEAALLPGPGDLVPACSCPDWADPCKHAAAVCYLVADLLDEDAFTLLALRGRDRQQVLSEIRARRRATGGRGGAGGSDPSAGDTGPVAALPTVSARDAYAAAAVVEPEARRWKLAEIGRRTRPAHPTAPPPLAVDPPPESGISSDDLADLGADAAERAFEMLAVGAPSGLGLTVDQDLARRVAQAFEEDDAATEIDLAWFSQTSGVPVHILRRDARAWLLGGAEAIDVLYERWSPTPDELEEGRDAIAMANRTKGANKVRADGNRLVAGPFQLRLARSGRWYRLEKAAGQWELRRRPADAPEDLFKR